MLVFTLELWPGGAVRSKRELAFGTITNDGEGTPESGSYRATITETGLRNEPVHERTWEIVLKGFPRNERNALDLLYRVLRAAVSYRNPDGD